MSMHWDYKYKLEGKEGKLDDFLYLIDGEPTINGCPNWHIREDAPEWALRSFAYMMNMGTDKESETEEEAKRRQEEEMRLLYEFEQAEKEKNKQE